MNLLNKHHFMYVHVARYVHRYTVYASRKLDGGNYRKEYRCV